MAGSPIALAAASLLRCVPRGRGRCIEGDESVTRMEFGGYESPEQAVTLLAAHHPVDPFDELNQR